jgi:hypothetical protein
MKVRSAKIADAKSIHSLINSYAEQDRMLFRSLTDIYENLQTFIVAESDGAMDSTLRPFDFAQCRLRSVQAGSPQAAVLNTVIEPAAQMGRPWPALLSSNSY